MTMPGVAAAVPEVELDALLEGVFRTYHYDFRHYARTFLHRRVERARASCARTTVPFVQRVLDEPPAFAHLLRHLTIPVSDLFRDPAYHGLLREEVIPRLATYPSPRIWVAGCGTGEEAYTMAILLAEAGILERSLVYATDIDPESLRVARLGTYDVERLRRWSESYFAAGGRGSLSDYYRAAYSCAAFHPFLRQRIVFADHCLATDAPFAEVQLASCRNVLIYFDRQLQDRALGLLASSLCPRGFLGLGSRESLSCSKHAASFEPLSPGQRVYRLR